MLGSVSLRYTSLAKHYQPLIGALSIKMNYGFTKLATNWNVKEMNSVGVRLIKAILFFIPRANPDQEKLYPYVVKWLIEIDEAGVPLREIGIDRNNTPLFAAPNNRNFGLWTDSDKKFEVSELEPSSKEEFESLWQKVVQNA